MVTLVEKILGTHLRKTYKHGSKILGVKQAPAQAYLAYYEKQIDALGDEELNKKLSIKGIEVVDGFTQNIKSFWLLFSRVKNHHHQQ